MWQRLCGIALAAGAVLLDPALARDGRTTDHEEVRVAAAAFAVPDVVAAPAPAVGHAVPLSGGRTHLIVDGTLNGSVTGPMLVDTGASYCVLTRTTARRLGLPTRSHRTIPVATANGRIDAGVVALDAIELHDARLAGVDAVVMDAVEPPFIGIIGLNFLTRFRFSIDANAGVLRLEP